MYIQIYIHIHIHTYIRIYTYIQRERETVCVVVVVVMGEEGDMLTCKLRPFPTRSPLFPMFWSTISCAVNPRHKNMPSSRYLARDNFVDWRKELYMWYMSTSYCGHITSWGSNWCSKTRFYPCAAFGSEALESIALNMANSLTWGLPSYMSDQIIVSYMELQCPTVARRSESISNTWAHTYEDSSYRKRQIYPRMQIAVFIHLLKYHEVSQGPSCFEAAREAMWVLSGKNSIVKSVRFVDRCRGFAAMAHVAQCLQSLGDNSAMWSFRQQQAAPLDAGTEHKEGPRESETEKCMLD